jgi:hypothetical protein
MHHQSDKPWPCLVALADKDTIKFRSFWNSQMSVTQLLVLYVWLTPRKWRDVKQISKRAGRFCGLPKRGQCPSTR